jgi:cardiolipin synthase A/B
MSDILPSGLFPWNRNTSPSSSGTTSAPPAAALQPVANAAESAIPDFFDRMRGHVANGAARVSDLRDKYIERPFATGRDGFAAVSADGSLSQGQAPGARIRDRDLVKISNGTDAIATVLANGEKRPVTFSLPGGRSLTTVTDDKGNKPLAFSDLGNISSAVDKKIGGTARIGISTPNGDAGSAGMMMLPADYDGPIFVSDIDDTLRDTSVGDVVTGHRQTPFPGATEALQAAAKLGIPIIYLSAGPDRIRLANLDFLSQLPPGILLDREHAGLKDLDPRNEEQARSQGFYKQAVLGQLKQTFPDAQLFGFGDDKFGDAYAYTRQGATSFIHDVRPGNDNLPADFDGTLVKSYDADFLKTLTASLKKAVDQSKSFGGTPGSADPYEKLSKKLDRVTGTQPSVGNKIELLVDGPAALPRILDGIDQAKKSVCYETFELHDDEVGNEVADHLIAAHERGVNVRVLADAVGSRHLPMVANKTIERLRAAGVDVRIYNPIDSVNDLVDFSRDHRKSVILDGSAAFIGGMNTGDEYMGSPDEVKGWRHDLFSRFEGPAVKDAAKDFADSWAAAGGAAIPESELQGDNAPRSDGVKMRVVAHVPDNDADIRAAYLSMIDAAQDHVNVENSFPMTPDLVDALCAAAQRGVKVNYIVGSNEKLLGMVAKKNYGRMLDAGVGIYIYPTPIHSKAVSVDGKMASIGSSNVDNVALDRNREIVALVEDPAWVADFEKRVFDADVVGRPDGSKTRKLAHVEGSAIERLGDGLLAAVWPDTFE